MNLSRRHFLLTTGAATASLYMPHTASSDDSRGKKRHIVTLSFDDGFKKSSITTAELFEKYRLPACINVVASAHLSEFQPPDYPAVTRGDFGLWNELQARGHEIMPHSYKHANLRQLPLIESKDLVRRCLDVFAKELKDFDPKNAVYNFAYNASTPELEQWLATQVRVFRTGGGALNVPGTRNALRANVPARLKTAVDRGTTPVF